MSVEPGRATREDLGSLGACLVEGDPEERKRERAVRRRALLVSILLQATAVAVLVLIPLFAKPPKIVQAYMPVPFYSHARPAPTHPEAPRPHSRPRLPDGFYAPQSIPPTIVTHEHPEAGEQSGPPALGEVPAFPGAIPLAPPQNVRPPVQPHAKQPHVVHVTHLDPAMLVHRVEPIYPVLPRQIGRSGRVELRATIGTDGSIQSLQIVSGDPMFYQSALEAVQQWRYRPTILNGQAVEVDAFITVIYNLQR